MKRITLAWLLIVAGVAWSQNPRPTEAPKRVPWTTSRIRGTPEPPPPYRLERVFPRLTFKNPLLLTKAPGTDRFFLGEQAGKIFSIPKDQGCTKPDLFLDLTTGLKSWDPKRVKGLQALYGLTFHPQFVKNRYCYICYVLDSTKPGESLPDGSRVSRFRVTDTDPPRVDPLSETVLITWLAGGHNGGCLCFGPDGYLYISTGDGASPNPPDALDTGQNISDLLSSVLRIDVDHPSKTAAYTVPTDNPFLDTPGARPEVWAYGFRNPWKMSFDRATGDLWLGDVGWELWEMVQDVKRGGNYGWSVMEGPQPVRPESRRGPTPILPPAFAFPHTEGASITGGFVYRGRRHKDLIGSYICGDWVTGRVWATRFDGDRVVSHREIARSPYHIVAFCEDNQGELTIVHYDDPTGTLHQLVPNEAAAHTGKFPRHLSETGLFASIRDQKPADGVIPFVINAEQWADHARAERFVALPGESGVRVHDSPVPIPGGFYSGQYFFPADGVLVKTIFMEAEPPSPASPDARPALRGAKLPCRRIETQILHFDGSAWNGYTYAWNDNQTDADLVPAEGMEKKIDVMRVGSSAKQNWRFHSRNECLVCHNPWDGYALAFTLPQLNRDDQPRKLQNLGILVPANGTRLPIAPGRLTNPYNTSADQDERARSYLQVNCAHCHQFGAGGTADLQLRYDVPLDQTKTIEVRPVQGTFEIPGAHIISPGNPFRSVLFYRISKLGRGRMPHIGSDVVDEQGVRLIHDWIQNLPERRKPEAELIRRLRSIESTSEPNSPVAWEDAALAIARASGRSSATDEDRQKAQIELKAKAAVELAKVQTERNEIIDRLLSSTNAALRLAFALGAGDFPEPLRAQIIARAMARPEVQIRDLFERFVPEDQRVQRLGTVIKPEQILSLKGNGSRGKELFFRASATQCVNCHRIAGTGATLGPDLSQIGKKYTRAQILESILEPSKSVDPPYVTYLVETSDGKVHTGILASKTAREIVLKNAGDKETRLPADKVTTLVPQKNSLMPELLLRDLTAQQVADLLAYLEGLK